MYPGLHAFQGQDRFLTFAPFADEQQLLRSALVYVLFNQGIPLGERIHTVRCLWRTVLWRRFADSCPQLISALPSVSVVILPRRPEGGNRV
jgi:hypothetical protein